MKKLSISNKGSVVVKHPRLVINNKRNWFDINSVRAECFEGVHTPKDKALAIWKFMRDNRLHYFEPDYGKEIDDPIKLLGVYGYGMCYNTSFVTASIASGFPYAGYIYKEYSPRNRHSVKDIKFDTTFALLDSDVEVFYLNNDNTQLSSYDEIARDHYLIRRVHHYGKGYNYNALNNFLADAVYEPTPPLRYAGLYTNYHTLDFQLRPGEQIEYNWEPAKYYHHYVSWATHNAPPEAIGNGRFIYSPNFANVALHELVNAYVGVSTFSGDGRKPNIHPAKTNDSSSFTIKVTSPFVIVNGKINGSFFRNNLEDYLRIYFSKDSTSWESVWESSQIGAHSDSITLYDKIKPIGSPALYHYYLKFEMLSTTEALSCGVDSLQIITDFQVSRFFLPSLELGENSISYNDESAIRNVEVEVEWVESSENAPPPRIEQPVFPADKSVVDSLKFTFKWQEAIDTDGVVDYEFMLSDRSDLRFPLSPSFEVYTSMTDNGGTSGTFTIPFDGMLNANTVYYWKVRAKDSKGVWGQWSPTWSFIPQGPMPPALEQSKLQDTTIILNWSGNEGGSVPAYYEIHASNRAFGFTPNESTLLDTLRTTTKIISIGNRPPKTFYRVVAVDKNGNRSGPSNYTMIEYPHVYNKPDSIKGNIPFKFRLEPNTVYTTDMLLLSASYSYNIRIYDSVLIKILHKPDWVKYNERTRTFYGRPQYGETNNDSIKIEFTSIRTGYKHIQVFKPPVGINSKPTLGDIDSVAYVNSTFDQTTFVVDPDFPLGDYVSNIEIINKPSWLTVEINNANGSIRMSGTPSLGVAADTMVTIKVYDSHNAFSVKTFPIKVKYSELDRHDFFAVAPNPFEGETQIFYEIEQLSDVNVKILSPSAQIISQTPIKGQPAGVHEIKWNSKGHPSGMYYVLIEITEANGNTKIASVKVIKL